ncbi:MAG TPA: sensor histidine kinase [Candidatus Brachybacterium merdavium]|uniref:Sensor histidine kinase n=1 Tax=Candidatus Brachybacterium merdavium TaxID=2838513 RepID=A0A9D2LAH8_9MICO|nr:sensor histidine kinase [Candidatus Brachybacterium merdavium]
MQTMTQPNSAAEPAASASETAGRPLTPREIHRAAKESGGLPFSLAPAVFLVIPAAFAWVGAPGGGAAIVTVLLAAYGVLFVYSPGIAEYPLPTRLLWFAAATALIALLGPLIGEYVLFMVMFQAMTHVILLPWRWAVPSAILVCLAVAVISLWIQLYVAAGFAVVGLVMTLGIGHGIRQQVLQEQLGLAQRRNAVLAVAAERERIGRDLHDILGHSLTSLTISAQLAQRLIEADPAAARAQLAHIEQTSRQALADVRATSSGMRTVRAATEIASARSVLASVGIEAEVPTALPALDDHRAELFGYVIREGVTNIVRHSGAHTATVTVTEDRVRISDDGEGIPAGTTRTGLAGLERRVAEAGGRLLVESSAAGTVLTAEMPVQAEQAEPAEMTGPEEHP